MKLLLCPKGYIGIRSKDVSVHIDSIGDGKRGYALVRDDIAEDLLRKPGYEIVDPKSYPRDIKVLYESVRKTLRQESLQELLSGVSKTKVKTSNPKTSTIPNPAFIPAIWTDVSQSNWPVTISYTDSSSSSVSFVFTKDFTIRPCVWCRFKYWLRSKFRRNKSK